MIKKIQVEGNPNLYRDKYSGAILNCNLEQIKLEKLKRKEKEKVKFLEEKVEQITLEMTEIKDLLKNIIQEIKK